MITKILQGVINITESGEYILALPSSVGRVQNSSAILNIDEVFVNVKEDVKATIYLPPISSFSNAWNTKIYLSSKGSTLLLPTNLKGGTVNYINYFTEKELYLGQSAYIHITSNENYGFWITDGGYKPIVEQSVTTQIKYQSDIKFNIGDVVEIPKSEVKIQLTLNDIKKAFPQDLYIFGTMGNVKLVQVNTVLINYETGAQGVVTDVKIE